MTLSIASAHLIEWNAEPESLEEIARVGGMAFFALDENERIVYWGQSAQSVFGMDPHSVMGKQRLRALPALSGSVRAASPDVQILNDAVIRVGDGTVRRYRNIFFPRFDGPRHVGGVAVFVPYVVEEASPSEPPLTLDPTFAATLEEARRSMAVGLPMHLDGEAGTEKLEVIRWLFPGLQVRSLPIGGDASGLTQLFSDSSPGVVFLEQVEDLMAPAQRVLRALVQRRCERAEAGDPPAPVALVTSSDSHRLTHVSRDLAVLLATLQITIPPLRRRLDDIEPAVHAVLRRFRAGPRQVVDVEPAAIEALKRHAWPGNMDELRLVVLRAALRSEGGVLRRDDLPEGVIKAPGRRRSGSDAEVDRIKKALEQSDGSVTQAADALGISRSTLWRQRRRHGL